MNDGLKIKSCVNGWIVEIPIVFRPMELTAENYPDIMAKAARKLKQIDTDENLGLSEEDVNIDELKPKEKDLTNVYVFTTFEEMQKFVINYLKP